MIALVLLLSSLAHAGPRGVVHGAPPPGGREHAWAARRVALVVGIDTYEDPVLGALRYAAKDSLDMATVLQDPSAGGFDTVSQLAGTVPGATFWSAFRAATGHLQRDDTFVLYVAGHGTLDLSPEGTILYVLPSDARLAHPDQGGIRVPDIERAMAALPARRRVLVLDTCYTAGGRAASSPELDARIKGLHKPLPAPVAVDARESDVRLFAAHDNQPAIEDSKLENGVYTHFFVEALSGRGDADGDGLVEVMEAHDWARDQTLAYTGGMQVPWVESTLVGCESIWLAGDPSQRKRAERALVEGLEALPSGATLTVDGAPRGAGVLDPGWRDLVVTDGKDTLLRSRVRARAGQRVDVARMVRQRRARGEVQGYGAWVPSQVWVPSLSAGVQMWWLPADPSGVRVAWGASVRAGIGDAGDLGSFPNGSAFGEVGAWVGRRILVGPELGWGGCGGSRRTHYRGRQRRCRGSMSGWGGDRPRSRLTWGRRGSWRATGWSCCRGRASRWGGGFDGDAGPHLEDGARGGLGIGGVRARIEHHGAEDTRRRPSEHRSLRRVQRLRSIDRSRGHPSVRDGWPARACSEGRPTRSSASEARGARPATLSALAPRAGAAGRLVHGGGSAAGSVLVRMAGAAGRLAPGGGAERYPAANALVLPMRTRRHGAVGRPDRIQATIGGSRGETGRLLLTSRQQSGVLAARQGDCCSLPGNNRGFSRRDQAIVAHFRAPSGLGGHVTAGSGTRAAGRRCGAGFLPTRQHEAASKMVFGNFKGVV